MRRGRGAEGQRGRETGHGVGGRCGVEPRVEVDASGAGIGHGGGLARKRPESTRTHRSNLVRWENMGVQMPTTSS